MSIAGGLLDPLAKKNIKRLIDALQAALTETEVQAVTQPQASATETS